MAINSRLGLVRDVETRRQGRAVSWWLREVEREFHARTSDEQLRPWSSWYSRVLMARPPSTQKLLVSLPEWWPEFEVPHKMFVPLRPAATYLEGHLARGSPLSWLCFRSAWVFNVAGR